MSRRRREIRLQPRHTCLQRVKDHQQADVVNNFAININKSHVSVSVNLPKIYLFTWASGQKHWSGNRREYDVPFVTVTGSGRVVAVAAHGFPGKENKDRNQATEIEKETIGTILEKWL